MTSERFREIEGLWRRALELEGSDRAAFLEQACGGDYLLRREVESLLAQDSDGQSFLETPAPELAKKMSGDDSGQSMIGRQFGPYSVVSLVAKGGMGEIYRARDTKLGRDVALKILPATFARDPGRLARFQREARLLASLNHPHIAAIYGIEESNGLHCLVMELVPGETLADAGPLPWMKALTICRQIAEGLEEAHRKNITHRDIKPANIKVTPAGTVRILDFGLAKALTWEQSEADLSELPTASGVATEEGRILGTPGYMSPEQVRGQTADKQTDIWSFGCVLYELLTGQHAFQRATLTDTIAAVLEREPDWQALPPATPAPVRDLLRRCLQKDKDRRLRDIGDARIEIEEAQSEPGRHIEARQSFLARWERLAWIAALILVAAIAFVIRRPAASAPSLPEMRVNITTPRTTDPLSLALSPDGQKIAFVGTSEGRTQLWVQSLDSVSAKPLTGTDGAELPFWSPDSRSIGFYADAQVKRIDLDSGAVRSLANSPNGRGGAWNRDGVILFTFTPASPIFRTSATGGDPSQVTHLVTPQEGAHRHPQFLPDGEHFSITWSEVRTYGGCMLGDSEHRTRDASSIPIHLQCMPQDNSSLSVRGLYLRRSSILHNSCWQANPHEWPIN